jgi:16S rRNA (cytidine1402-2'-O)-methyltransferase
MGKLYLIPTPIGNLEDITLRAIRMLKEADLILAEDTRVCKKLLQHYEIKTAVISHHQHNEHKTVGLIAERIQAGEIIALTTDAGTPAISDPGYLLVKECIEKKIEVETLPGATAFVPALVNSGLPNDRFFFEGFLPTKKGRNTRLTKLAELEHTIILYESPYRLIKTLEQIKEFFGVNRKICVSRELTKIYEENIRGNADEIIAFYKDKKIKGEIVVIVQGKTKKE